MGGGKGKSQTSGYSYYFSIHMGLCRGPINELVEIRVGDKIAYKGSLTSLTSFTINKPNLFGGQKSEGGLVGGFYYMPGAAGQTIPGNVSAALTAAGTLVPQFRGVVTAYYDGLVSQNNPYIKEWKFRVRRSTEGWDGDCWYPIKAAIGMGIDGYGQTVVWGMNPAHIIYECTTNRVWGRGLPASIIDEESFISAANTLCDEGFGLCMRWDRTDAISNFVNEVIDHIGGALYIDRTTGLLTLKLFRADYDEGDLPVFSYDSGLIEIEEDQAGSATENYNEIVVKYHDQVEDEARQVRVHNLGAIQAVGSVVSKSVDYRGVPTAELAIRLAERDLTANANWLRRFKLKLDRRGWKIAPGTVFRISVPSRNIDNMVLRAGEIVDGPLNEGTVTVKAVQDVFGLGSTSYLEYTAPTWTPPDRTARPIFLQMAMEADYRAMYQRLSAADLAALVDTQCTLATFGRAPTDLSQSYDVASYVSPESYTIRGSGDFTPSAFLDAALGLYDTAVTFTEPQDMDTVDVGEAVLIGTELCRVEAIDVGAGTMTVARGCGDTLPQTHEAGEGIWLAEGYGGTDFRDYTPSEEVFVKLLTKTSADILEEADATEMSVTMAQRFFRPYPPGNFEINGEPYANVPFSIGDPVLTWAHRDRVGQQDRLIGHTDGDEGPEAGQTYNIRVYDNDDVLVRTVTGLTGTTWTYLEADWITDGSPTRPRFELESERDGIASLMLYSHRLIRTVTDPGWDEAWSFNYGGGP